MKNLVPVAGIVFLFLAVLLLPGCSAIAGIFKAGVWTGFILVAVVLLLVVLFLSRAGRNK